VLKFLLAHCVFQPLPLDQATFSLRGIVVCGRKLCQRSLSEKGRLFDGFMSCLWTLGLNFARRYRHHRSTLERSRWRTRFDSYFRRIQVICLVAFLPIGLKFQLCELLSQSHYHVLFLTQLLFLLIFVNIVGAFVWRLICL
jgi:hypothetical protein